MCVKNSNINFLSSVSDYHGSKQLFSFKPLPFLAFCGFSSYKKSLKGSGMIIEEF